MRNYTNSGAMHGSWEGRKRYNWTAGSHISPSLQATLASVENDNEEPSLVGERAGSGSDGGPPRGPQVQYKRNL